MKTQNFRKYAFEFLSIFIAVISAFALQNWNENRRDDLAASKILIEIKKGLQKDIDDLKTNISGHRQGIQSCQFIRSILNEEAIEQDSVQLRLVRLTRDFTSLQNSSGYETLKSRGLELIRNDALRTELISLYEYDYSTLKSLEENYEEMQFQKQFFHPINTILAPNYEFDKKGNITKIKTPLAISAKEKKMLLSYLMKIELNRTFVLRIYQRVSNNIDKLKASLEEELSDE